MTSSPPCNQGLQTASLAIHRMLLAEHDLPTLLQGICDRLVEVDLVRSSWVVLLDREVGGVITAETGLGPRIDRIMAPLRDGILPECGRHCIESEKNTVHLCSKCTCGVCDSASGQVCALTVPLRCRPGLVGFLVLELADAVPVDREGFPLLEELADSISLALRRLFISEETRQREQEHKRVEERFELALYASRAGLWDWNIRTGEMYTSPDRREYLDYRTDEGEAGVSALNGVIHPEDQDRVLQVLNDHLAGKTEEYRIEYRIRDRKGNWRWFHDRGRVVERDEKNMPVRMTGTHQDITRQKEQDEALAEVQRQMHQAVDHERHFLQAVIDGAADPVMAIDTGYRVLLINRVAAKLLRVYPDEIRSTDRKCYELFAGREQPCRDRRNPCPVAAVLEKNDAATLIHHSYHCNGIGNTFEIEVSPLRDQDGRVYGAIEVARDITDRLRIEEELRESRSRLYRLAHHDSLTGLPNRLLFRDRLEQAVFKAKRIRSKLAVLFLDLDRFKQVNDTLGHDVGDGLLIEVANRLQRLCRQSDTVARMGGDEFVFILDNIGDRDNATLVAAKILEAMKEPVRVGDHELEISTSIGIALYPDDSEDIDGVIKCADMALYRAKGEGRSDFRMYSPDMMEKSHSLLLSGQEVTRAIAAGEFFLEYQGQYDLATGKPIGLEALVRWNHPEQGILYPFDFLSRAEESGSIVEIGQWVLDEVGKQLTRWRDQGLPMLPVAVNLSPRQLRDPEFPARIAGVLERYDLRSGQLELELDEAAMMEGCRSRSFCELEKVGNLGVRLAVEDFGIGRFSLGDLQRLPLSRIKIDRSFMRCLSDPKIALVVDAIIVLAHNLERKVLAEGVEQESQLAFLREHGCDQAQGYYLSRPLRGDQVARLPDLKTQPSG